MDWPNGTKNVDLRKEKARFKDRLKLLLSRFRVSFLCFPGVCLLKDDGDSILVRCTFLVAYGQKRLICDTATLERKTSESCRNFVICFCCFIVQIQCLKAINVTVVTIDWELFGVGSSFHTDWGVTKWKTVTDGLFPVSNVSSAKICCEINTTEWHWYIRWKPFDLPCHTERSNGHQKEKCVFYPLIYRSCDFRWHNMSPGHMTWRHVM